jgi:Fe-S cluster biogenesis protein NfuA
VVARQKKPLLVPDPHTLRRMKGLLRIPGALPTAPNLVEDTGPLAAPSVPVTTVSTEFEGLSQLDNAVQTGAGVLPSDSNLGVGPTEIFQMVNQVGRITNKLGSPGSSSTFALDFFFGVDFFSQGSDPRIVYDALSGRWFAVYLQFSTIFNSSAVILAVSTTSSPTLFCKYQIGSNVLQDFPTLGLSSDKVAVGYDGYQWDFQTFVGTGYYVLDKAALVNCASSVAVAVAPPDASRNTIQPVQSLGSTNDLYMAMHVGSSATLTLLKVSGVPGLTPVTETATALAITRWLAPPDALQGAESGGTSSQLLDTNDARVLTAAWQNQSLWLAGNEACTPTGDSTARSCLRMIEVRTDTMTVPQDMTYGAADQYYYYPAVRPDSLGNVYVVFTASSAVTFAGVQTTGRLAGDAPNTLQASSLLRAGGGEQTHSSGRTGDYSGAAVDPGAPHTVWVMAEYIQAPDPFLTDGVADWGTYVAQLSFSSAPPPSFTLTLTKAVAGTGTGTVTSQPAGIDCGPGCSVAPFSYASGALVTLTATAASGSVFKGWGGACSGTASTCTVTMNADTQVSARFDLAPPTFTLTVTKAAAGTGTGTVTSQPAGINCGTACSTASAVFDGGTVVTLTAKAAPGSAFKQWSGACTTSPCTVTMNAAKTVTATFNKKGKK